MPLCSAQPGYRDWEEGGKDLSADFQYLDSVRLIDPLVLSEVWPDDFRFAAVPYVPLLEGVSGPRLLTTTPHQLLSTFRGLIDHSILPRIWPEHFPRIDARALVQNALSRRRQIEAKASGEDNEELVLEALGALSLQTTGTELTSSTPAGARAVVTKAQSDEQIKRGLARYEKLDEYGFSALRTLLAAQEDKSYIDLRWLVSGALSAAGFEALSVALQDAVTLNLSGSATLTTDALQALLQKLPRVQHVIALGCPLLKPLTMHIPLSTYLSTHDLGLAVQEVEIRSDYIIESDYLQWVEPTDPPPALTVLIYTRPPRGRIVGVRRTGIELPHMSADGVARSFKWLLDFLYCDVASSAWQGFLFPLRAAFHDDGCLPPCIYRSPGRDEMYGSQMAQGKDCAEPGPAPRYPGWTLVLDSRGSVPALPVPRGQKPLLEMIREASGNDMLFRPVYGFIRWEKKGPEDEELVPVEVLGLREWAACLADGHGKASEEALTACEHALLEQKATLITLAGVVEVANWGSELWEPMNRIMC